jgi:hypothetical protein
MPRRARLGDRYKKGQPHFVLNALSAKQGLALQNQKFFTD